MKRGLFVVLLALSCLMFTASTAVAAPKAVTGATYDNVVMYAGPLNLNSNGLIIPLFTTVKTGKLGYASSWFGATTYPYGNTTAYKAFDLVFSAKPMTGSFSCSWSDPKHRITYAYPGYTKVRFNGVEYDIDSAEARAALGTPGVKWMCTYRERYDTYSADGIGFNGWAVSCYYPSK